MSRQQPPDRLAAILAELDEGRRTPWLPDEDELIDRRPLLGGRWRSGRRDETALVDGSEEQGLAALGFEDADEDDEPWHGSAPRSRSERRARARSGPVDGPALRPHTPLFRSPLPDTDIESRPGRSALVGALVVLVVAGLVLGFRVWSAREQASPAPLTVPAGATSSTRGGNGAAPTGDGGSGRTSASVANTAAPQANSGFVLVHVVGQVRRPGVVRLPAGSRVNDAITAAGGALPGADLSAVNLARPLGDGEQVHVPKPGEQPPVAAGPASGATPGAAGPSGAAAGPVNLNTATEAQFDTLPGVGPVLAARIVSWRTTNGRFTSIDDLGEVSGIGDKLLEQLRPLVTV